MDAKDRILFIRNNLGLTQKGLAQLLGCKIPQSNLLSPAIIIFQLK